MLFRGCKKSSKIMFVFSFGLSFLGTLVIVLSMLFPILKGPLVFLPTAVIGFLALPLLTIPLALELINSLKVNNQNRSSL